MSVSELQSNMEDLAKAAGLDISSEPNFEEQPQQFELVDEQPAQDQPVQEQVSQSEAVEEQQVAEPVTETQQGSLENGNVDLSDDEFNDMLVDYVSERLGVSINSLEELSDYINREPEPAYVDDRIAKIAEFVSNTGRSPEDWFRYQQLDPAEMDDLSVIRLQTLTDYPNLNPEQVNKLVNSRYKLDEDLFSEEEIELSKIQMQIDADKARAGINSLREDYMLPVQQYVEDDQQEDGYLFDDNWMNYMVSEVDALDAMEFDLGDDRTFTFGLNDEYKGQLKQKNAQLEEFFDPYVDSNGNWDIETLSMHRALIDNIDAIAASIYQQGLSDGQKNLVNKAANVQTSSPGIQQNQQTDSVIEQIKQALGGGDNLMRFK
jgi:hypothetical protein